MSNQSIIAEFADHYNTLVDYHTTLHPNDFQPWLHRDQALNRMAMAVWKHAAFIVARQAGINLTWKPQD